MADSYKMKCPVAKTLEVIGERWTILVIRDLVVEGPCRFQFFLESLNGITPGVLSKRLKKLEEHGVISRRFYSEHPPRAEYLLTERGRELAPIIKQMRDWSSHDRTAP